MKPQHTCTVPARAALCQPLVLSGLTLMISLATSHAQSKDASAAPASRTNSSLLADFTSRDYLLGDWNGHRTSLEEKGYVFTLSYTVDSQRNFSGGLENKYGFFGRARFIMDVDLEKAAGIRNGRFFVSALSQNGDILNRNIGTYSPLSSIAGDDTTRLDQLYYEHSFLDDYLSIRLGQVAGMDEFGAQHYGTYFVNNQLGYSTGLEFNTRIPFNAAAQPGIIVRAGKQDAGLYGKAGIFSGKPDPFNNDKHGVDFDIEDHSIVYAGEIGYKFARSLPGDIRAGFHYNNGKFTRLDDGSEVNDNYVVYAMVNQTLWQDSGDPRRGFDLGIGAYFAPSSRNTTSTEFLVSAIYRGFLPSRPDDSLALGFVRNEMGYEASKASRLSGSGYLGDEYVVELSYKAFVTPWLVLQPDLQYIANPAGTDRQDVWVLGLRTAITF